MLVGTNFKKDGMDPGVVNLKTLEILNAVEEMHKLGVEEIGSLLRGGSRSLKVRLTCGDGSPLRVDLERVARGLPMHLIVFLLSTEQERTFDKSMKYLLRGVRLLFTLSELAFRNAVLGQILHEDVEVREQVLELIVYLLTCLASYDKETELLEPKVNIGLVLTHAALSACTLHLLPVYVSHDWSNIAIVIVQHPQAAFFLNVTFDVVTKAVSLFHIKLSSLSSLLWAKKATTLAAERYAYSIAQHCEAALQAVYNLCLNFRDTFLRDEELCKKGGVLRFVYSVLSLELPRCFLHSRRLVACISRLKSKSLSVLLKFCESENSFLDEVVSSQRSKELAMAVAQKILGLLRAALLDKPTVDGEGQAPMGLVYITSMRLADILTDDSSFRNFIMDGITRHLATVLAAAPLDFQARWCGGLDGAHAAVAERDTVLRYNTFHAAGAAMLVQKGGLGVKSGIPLQDYNSGCAIWESAVPDHKTQQRSSLLVKLFANLFCFNPEMCSADQKDRFLHLLLEHLVLGPLCPEDALFFLTVEQTAVRICENLHKLIDHVVSLASDDVTDEDLFLVSEFSGALHSAICPSQHVDEAMEPPVISFVREAHEQKLGALLERRQKLERWKQLQLGAAAQLCQLEGKTPDTEMTEARASVDEDHDTRMDGVSNGVQAINDERALKDGHVPRTGEDLEDQAQDTRHVDHEDLDDTGPHKQDSEPSRQDEVPGMDDAVHQLISEARNMRVDDVGKLKPAYVNSSKLEGSRPVEVPSSKTLRKIKVVNNSSDEDERKAENEDEQAAPDRNLNSGWQNAEPAVSDQQYPHNQAGDGLAGNRSRGTKEGRSKDKTKRKRNIMNEKQIAMLESQLTTEPDMQRKPVMIREWTVLLKQNGPEITENQLKNWLNNRKQRLARLARGGAVGSPTTRPAHLGEAPFVTADTEMPGPHHDSGSGSIGQAQVSSGQYGGIQEPLVALPMAQAEEVPEPAPAPAPLALPHYVKGQQVILLDDNGRELGIGTIDELDGIWRSRRLDEQNLCLVEVTKLKVGKETAIPYPSQRGGGTFGQAEALLGIIMVFWSMTNMRPVG